MIVFQISFMILQSLIKAKSKAILKQKYRTFNFIFSLQRPCHFVGFQKLLMRQKNEKVQFYEYAPIKMEGYLRYNSSCN